MPRERIALQLYTVRGPAATDLLGTLEEVARIGYGAVELAGFHGVAPAEIRAQLDRLGVRAVAAHCPFSELDGRTSEVLARLSVIGAEYVVVPSLPPELTALDRVDEVARTLGAWGELAARAGLRLAYHNHNVELQLREPGGLSFLDLLAGATDPALVRFELDVYWAHRAGVDPVETIERYTGRIPLLHVKDARADGRDAPVGEGELAWPEILAAATRAGVEWYVVEQDEPEDLFANVATSLLSLGRMLTRGVAPTRAHDRLEFPFRPDPGSTA